MINEELKMQLVQIFETEKKIESALHKITDLLQSNLANYQWVGFYFMNHANKTLHLGPYSGDETEHTVIPFGKGICGQVAESGETFTVEDVNAQDNYIACSIYVKSEIVVPLYLEGQLIGQIDIDSHKLNAFGKEDELFLEDLCNMLAVQYGESLKELAEDISK